MPSATKGKVLLGLSYRVVRQLQYARLRSPHPKVALLHHATWECDIASKETRPFQAVKISPSLLQVWRAAPAASKIRAMTAFKPQRWVYGGGQGFQKKGSQWRKRLEGRRNVEHHRPEETWGRLQGAQTFPYGGVLRWSLRIGKQCTAGHGDLRVLLDASNCLSRTSIALSIKKVAQRATSRPAQLTARGCCRDHDRFIYDKLLLKLFPRQRERTGLLGKRCESIKKRRHRRGLTDIRKAQPTVSQRPMAALRGES